MSSKEKNLLAEIDGIIRHHELYVDDSDMLAELRHIRKLIIADRECLVDEIETALVDSTDCPECPTCAKSARDVIAIIKGEKKQE